MYSNYKRIGCFMLVLVLCFCVLANPMIQPKAQAVAGVVGAGALSIIVYLLGALGITASSKGTIHQLAEGIAGEIESSEPTLFSWLNKQAIDTATGKAIWVPDTTGINIQSTVSKLVLKVMQIVGKNKATKGETTVDVVDPKLGVFGNAKYTYKSSFINANEAFSYTYVSLFKDHNSISTSYSIITNGVKHSFRYVNCDLIQQNYFRIRSDDNQNVFYYDTPTSTRAFGEVFNFSPSDRILDARIGFQCYSYNNTNYLKPFMAYQYVDYMGLIKYGYEYSVDVSGKYCSIPISGDGMSLVSTAVDYQELISYELAQMRLGLTEKLNEILAAVGSISIPMDEPYSDVVEGKEERDKERDGIPFVPGIPVTDWAKIWEQLKLGEKVTAKDPAIPIQQEQDLDVQTLPDVRDKFPFCVPFDLIALIGALNATPVVPKWDIPFKINSLGINEKITLDFTQFESVAAVIRWVTTISFVLGLILLTRKLIQA